MDWIFEMIKKLLMNRLYCYYDTFVAPALVRSETTEPEDAPFKVLFFIEQ
jgi:hypothetical protein